MITATIKNIGSEAGYVKVSVSFSDGYDTGLNFAFGTSIDDINSAIALLLKNRNVEVGSIEELKPFIGTIIEPNGDEEAVVKSPGRPDATISTKENLIPVGGQRVTL